jgi:hypothetical protein
MAVVEPASPEVEPASLEVEVRIQAPERDKFRHGGACARAMSIFRVAHFFKVSVPSYFTSGVMGSAVILALSPRVARGKARE